MENTKAKNVVITILVILLLCCLGVIAWQYMQLNDNKAPEVSTQDGANTENKVEELKREDLDINSELVQKLYGYIPNTGGFDFVDEETGKVLDSAYQPRKITIENMDNSLVLWSAFVNNTIPEEEKIPYEVEAGDCDDFAFSADLLQKMVKEMYGKNVENESFDFGYVRTKYENGIYKYSCGGGGNPPRVNTDIKEAYKYGDELYIEDTFLLLYEDGEKYDDETEKYILEIYNSTSTKIKEIETKLFVHEDDDWNQLIKQYENQAQKYKHTFKLSEEGTYYWYSTEPIN